ncbi:unnamed protein product [Clonostachys solani]|uniref:Uncharacterized protein n=1 Tax=Clonostachys solani TaxID=160281 RepID=A0A9N9Z6W8_9HYPO|nr:unnamed protein product [Clonostachys solani]
MVTFTSSSGSAPARSSYREELAKLRESKTLTKELILECVETLLPQDPVYTLAVKNWYFLDQKSRSYLAKALGPDEDFPYINDHLILATEPTQSSGVYCHFEELVASGMLKPPSGYTNLNDSASSDAAVRAAPSEIHPAGSSHSPAKSSVFAPLPPSPTFSPESPGIYWKSLPPTPNIHPQPVGENQNTKPASGNFFGQRDPLSFRDQHSITGVKTPGKAQTVASGGGLFGARESSGTSIANLPLPGTPLTRLDLWS